MLTLVGIWTQREECLEEATSQPGDSHHHFPTIFPNSSTEHFQNLMSPRVILIGESERQELSYAQTLSKCRIGTYPLSLDEARRGC